LAIILPIDGIQQLHRLDVPPAPALILDGDHLDPRLRRRALGKTGLCLGEQDDGRGGPLGRIGEIAIRRPARDLQVDQPVLDPVPCHELTMDVQQLLHRHRAGHLQLPQRPLQPRRVPVEIDQLAAKDARHLVDPVREQEAAIEDGHLRLFLGQVFAIDKDGAGHGRISF
jgi:hypothetical protein